MVPNIWKNFCASDGNVKMRFRIVSKNTKFSTLYTLKGPQLWDGEILQDEKNNWANFMCIKCKENIAHTRTSARYNWSKKYKGANSDQNLHRKEHTVHSITIWLFQSQVLKFIVNEILTFQSCTSLVHKRWWRRWREQQWTRSWTWKFGMDGPVGYNY